MTIKADEKAILAGGCFWCTEAIYQQMKGIKAVIPGYIGGKTIDPNYQDVCTGTTGHAEAVEITFDPEIVSFEEILEVFFGTHDPTTRNKQGADVGTQYRSGIFYKSQVQQEKAIRIIQLLNEEKTFNRPIVTEVTKATTFYKAENYHQDYYQRNPNQGYCQFVIDPKVKKFKTHFSEYLK